MKIFISWSKEGRSKSAALLLQKWLKRVIQALEPWTSSEDIKSGAKWFNVILDELSRAKIGIICLTSENKGNPWLLFEAGAIVNGLTNQRAHTFLVDLKDTDISFPLANFNHTSPTKESMFKLVKGINAELGERMLSEIDLKETFDVHWPKFQEDFNKILLEPINDEVKPKIEVNLTSEILSIVRSMDKRLAFLETQKEESNAMGRPRKTFAEIVIEHVRELIARGAAYSSVRDYVRNNVTSESMFRNIMDIVNDAYGFKFEEENDSIDSNGQIDSAGVAKITGGKPRKHFAIRKIEP